MFLSLAIHLTILGVLIVVPLVCYQVLPDFRWVAKEEFLTAVVAPPPPKPEIIVPKRPLQVFKLDPARFVAPSEIPGEIPVALDDIPEISALSGIMGECVGEVTVGILEEIPGDLNWGEIRAVPTEAPEPVLQPTKTNPIRVGGNVQPSRLLQWPAKRRS